LDYSVLDDADTIVSQWQIFRPTGVDRGYDRSWAEVMILGNDSSSTLKLLTVYRSDFRLIGKNDRKNAIKTFEKNVIKRIKKI
jgi:hypothetical protein